MAFSPDSSRCVPRLAESGNAGPRNVKDFDRILKAAVETDFAQSIPYLSAEIGSRLSLCSLTLNHKSLNF
jgi:hypothetical protein